MDKRPWSRNQKIALWGTIVAAMIGILSWFAKIDLKVSYIQDEIENIKIKNADIKSLVVDELLKKCPPGTSTTTIEFTDEGMRFGCIPPD